MHFSRRDFLRTSVAAGGGITDDFGGTGRVRLAATAPETTVWQQAVTRLARAIRE